MMHLPKGSSTGYAFCGDTAFIDKKANCTPILNEAKFKEFWHKNCVGKTECQYNLADP